MSPNTLTNAQKYSSEFGFDPGVVLEVVLGQNVAHFGPDKPYVFRFKGYSEYEIVILEENGGNELQPYPTEIKSIRLLSWPWAVWQGAPSGTVGVSIDDDERCPIFFFQTNDYFKEAVQDPRYKKQLFMPAPWWWLEGQK